MTPKQTLDEVKRIMECYGSRLKHRIEGLCKNCSNYRVTSDDVENEFWLAFNLELQNPQSKYHELNEMERKLWIFKMAVNVFLKQVRFQNAEKRTPKSEASVSSVGFSNFVYDTLSPSQKIAKSELERDFNLARKALSEIENDILELRLCKESYNDISIQLGITANNATQKYVRAVAKIKKLLESKGYSRPITN